MSRLSCLLCMTGIRVNRSDLTVSTPDPRKNLLYISLRCSLFLSAFLKKAHRVDDDRAIKHVSTPKSDRAMNPKVYVNFARQPDRT